MEFKQFYLECLAHASYLVGDDGECAIVDPQRDVERYLDEARARGSTIRHVIETHLHADFVSGHVELAQRTGARIHVGHAARPDYDAHLVHDGDEIRLGRVVLRFLETPGHTPESLCVLVLDERVSEQPLALLTGDTLFIGDVGRPDLVAAHGRTAAEMAGLLYDSLRRKIMPLPDAIRIFPAHGAGSACGRNISTELSSTLGAQKALNPALADMTREQFVALATAGLSPAPPYFAHDAELNRRGAPPLDALPAPAPLTPDELAARRDAGAIVLDVRDAASFGAGHVPGAVNIGLGGRFASWCGTLLPLDAELLLVADSTARAAEAVVRLARVGLHGVAGRLAGGLDAWRAAGHPVAELPQLAPSELAARRAAGGATLDVLDVRTPAEHDTVHVPGARNLQLAELPARLRELDPERPVAVVCKSGYRSSAAASLLQRAGFGQVVNVTGGTDAWVAGGLPTESAAAGGCAAG